MATDRLEVRLDPERRRRLAEVAGTYDVGMSEAVRVMIDRAYEDVMRERRRAAVERMATLQLDVPDDPAELKRQILTMYDDHDLH